MGVPYSAGIPAVFLALSVTRAGADRLVPRETVNKVHRPC
jgi:hypothetical protein